MKANKMPKILKENIACKGKTVDEIDSEILGKKFLAAALGCDELHIDFILPPINQVVKVTGDIFL